MTEIMDVPTIEAQTSAPETEPTGWMSPTGDIRDGAPENIRTLLENKKWNNINQLVDGYKELEKFTGVGKHLVIPENEDDAGWEAVYELMGCPKDVKEYEFDEDPDVPFDEELLGRFKQGALEQKLNKKQANWIVGLQRDIIKEVQATEQQQKIDSQNANVEEVKKRFGDANCEAKIREARSIADKLGIYQTLEAKGLASDPDIISMLNTIASRSSEDTLVPPGAPPAQKSLTEELDEIKKSEEFTKRFHPKHKECMARYMALCQQIANERR